MRKENKLRITNVAIYTFSEQQSKNIIKKLSISKNLITFVIIDIISIIRKFKGLIDITVNMIAVIYARVSSTTGRQDTERQVSELTAYAKANNIEVTKFYQDFISGATANKDRWVLQDCLKYCTKDNPKVNCILMSEVSRLGRDTWEMIELVKFFHDNHLNVYFMRENLWMYNLDGTENPLFSMLFAMFSKFAENERTAIKERLQSGYKSFRAKGGKVGRKLGSKKTTKQLEGEYKQVLKELRKGTSIARTAKLCDVSTSTVARLKKAFSINQQKIAQ